MGYQRILVGGMTNAYLVYDEKKRGFLVDPGAEGDKILAIVEAAGVKVEAILLTHAHGDHISALNRVRDALGVKVYMHKDEMVIYESADHNFVAMLGGEVPDRAPDVLVEDGDTIELECGEIRVMHTPGHTPGSVCYFYEDLILSGDTLFQGSIGRTDFPLGDIHAMADSLRKLTNCDENAVVLSGHGFETTIDDEKRSNPFIRQLL